MIKQCPNCSKEFIESRETAFRCEDCGWFKNIDGQWHTCPEPAEVIEPDFPKEPKAPAEPESKIDALDLEQKKIVSGNVSKPDDFRSYLGGLVTVTPIKDDENEELN